MASEIIKADRLHLLLLSDGTRIDDNEYLESLENGAELIVCTEEQIQELSIYFGIKRYLSLKNISHSLTKIVDYCESSKQMGRVCVSRISMTPCKLQGRTAGSQGSLGKRRWTVGEWA